MPSTTELAMIAERHYSVKELAAMWKLSPAAIRRLFRKEPGVLAFGQEKRGHQRAYLTLRIPAAVAERVYRRSMRPGFHRSEPDKSKGGP